MGLEQSPPWLGAPCEACPGCWKDENVLWGLVVPLSSCLERAVCGVARFFLLILSQIVLTPVLAQMLPLKLLVPNVMP